MQLHPSVIERLLKIYTTYGGYREEHRLRDELQKISLSPYTQQTGNKQSFLVLSSDIEEYLNSLDR
jgi:hypothetical protein